MSTAHFLKKEFSAYSFGRLTNPDISIPEKQSKLLGVDFQPILLEQGYINTEYIPMSYDIILESAANTNMLQVHFPYAASKLNAESKVAINGIFGSELFRAVHLTGQFASPSLIDYFLFLDSDEWISKIKHAKCLNYLQVGAFTNEIDNLIDELQDYKRRIIDLTPNQRFYKYVFEEIFRKFFGNQFIIPQTKFVIPRSPYLDFSFIKELLKTKFAGVNNDFFTHNPLKRFKGQLFYANLIQRTWPELGNLITGKGYTSKDIINNLGYIRILSNYVNNKLTKRIKGIDYDNLAIFSAFKHFLSSTEDIQISDDFYNSPYIKGKLMNDNWKNDRDKFIETISINIYLKQTA
jgi:hypothetical protein